MLRQARVLSNANLGFHIHFQTPLLIPTTTPSSASTRVFAFSAVAAASSRYKYPNPSTATTPAAAPLKRVGTHNGSFHCDDALACFMIRLTHNFDAAQILRSRDPEVLEDLDAVVDVGGVYNPSRDRYDHHQKGFEEAFGHGFSTKLSSAGLVYKHYGKEIIAKELQVDEDHPHVHILFLAIYKNFMEAIDAVDNGINQHDSDKPARYVNNTNLSSRVGRLNLDWTDPHQSPEKENEAFHRAMALAGVEFLDSVRFHAKSWLPARSIVVDSLMARKGIDHNGEILVLKFFCPWKLHLHELEKELKIDPTVKYVIYQDERSKHWRLQAVAVSPDSFESRRPLPVEWRGLEGGKLSTKSGITGCVFVHSSGFIGGNQTYEGALAMAKAGLNSTFTFTVTDNPQNI